MSNIIDITNDTFPSGNIIDITDVNLDKLKPLKFKPSFDRLIDELYEESQADFEEETEYKEEIIESALEKIPEFLEYMSSIGIEPKHLHSRIHELYHMDAEEFDYTYKNRVGIPIVSFFSDDDEYSYTVSALFKESRGDEFFFMLIVTRIDNAGNTYILTTDNSWISANSLFETYENDFDELMHSLYFAATPSQLVTLRDNEVESRLLLAAFVKNKNKPISDEQFDNVKAKYSNLLKISKEHDDASFMCDNGQILMVFKNHMGIALSEKNGKINVYQYIPEDVIDCLNEKEAEELIPATSSYKKYVGSINSPEEVGDGLLDKDDNSCDYMYVALSPNKFEKFEFDNTFSKKGLSKYIKKSENLTKEEKDNLMSFAKWCNHTIFA